MRIKKFNESKDELDDDLIKSFMHYIEDELPEVQYSISDSIFTSNNEPPDIDDGGDCYSLVDYEPGVDIITIGWLVRFEFDTTLTLDIEETNNFIKIISLMKDISKRIYDEYDCKCFLRITDSAVTLIIKKLKPTIEDYYKVLIEDISYYANSTGAYFQNCKIEKRGSDYILTLTSNRQIGLMNMLDKNYEEIEKLLKNFTEDDYEEISYDDVNYSIDGKLLKVELKNPKIQNLKIKI